MAIENLIIDHLDLWTAAVRPKSSAGRGSNSKLELTGIKKLRELILELAAGRDYTFCEQFASVVTPKNISIRKSS
ncbi:hypothetical protein, partial [Aeromonas sp. Y318-3]|uniref:hypothetical protein n=1 Tax=Aeromonas sp. Y318-3 TaxID=2990509 RepID=UPI0022E5EEC9